MRLAIFGGTFDPIHNAHLAIARAALSHFRLDRVLFVPAEHPPHKDGATAAGFDHRVRMAELAVADEPRFAVSRLEEGTRRSYSIDTIEKVRASLSTADELFFLIGADAFAEIQTWHRWQDVARQVAFLVVSRPGHSFAVPEGVTAERLDSPQMDISSSAIRRGLERGERDAEVPPPVFDYIKQHGLYGTPSHKKRPFEPRMNTDKH
ncbi:MAG: nicotinate-nucleotide adenylyltransferase [Bryobacteraceae bacterium]|jgi:nicotinate-nucleotide adenylyltransferase